MTSEARLLHPLNEHLPNAADVRKESHAAITHALDALKAVKRQADENGYTDIRAALREFRLLDSIHHLHYVPAQQEWKELVELLVHLLFCEDADVAAQNRISTVLAVLLRTKQPRETLTVDWRPFWTMMQRTHLSELNPSEAGSIESVSKHQGHLGTCIRHISRYFPASAAAEIAEFFSVGLAELHADNVFTAQAALYIFLPSWATIKDVTPELAQFWLRTWAHIDRCVPWDFTWASIFARLAHPQRLESSFEWHTAIPLLFSRLLGSFSLPVSDQRSYARPYGRYAKPMLAFRPMGAGTLLKLAVRLFTVPIPPAMNENFGGTLSSSTSNTSTESGGADASVMGHFERLLRVLSTHFYPSAALAGYFASFLRVMVAAFVKRMARENAERRAAALLEGKAAAGSLPGRRTYVSDQLVTRFVDLVLPLASMGLYLPRANKGSWASEVARTFSNLAMFAPDRVCNEIVTMATVALDPTTVNQTHMAPNVMEVLADVLPSLLYPVPVAVQHLPQLLLLALPGVDPNDDKKSTSALELFNAVLRHIPLLTFDDIGSAGAPSSSEEAIASLPAWHPASARYSFADSHPLHHAAMEAEDIGTTFTAAREVLPALSEWVLLALDRVFKLLETHGKPPSSKASRRRTLSPGDQHMLQLHSELVVFVERAFNQMSPSLRATAIQRTFAWYTSVSCLDTEQVVARMLTALMGNDSEVILAKFLPHILGRIDATSSPELLRWFASGAAGLLGRAGKAAVPYVAGVSAAVSTLFQREDAETRKLGGKLLRALMETLLSTVVHPIGHSHIASDSSDVSSLWKKLGQPYTWSIPAGVPQVVADTIKPLLRPVAEVTWNTPTEGMRQAALQVARTIVWPVVADLARIARGEAGLEILLPLTAPGSGSGLFAGSILAADRFRAALELLRAALRGMALALTDSTGVRGDDDIFSSGTSLQAFVLNTDTNQVEFGTGAAGQVSLRHFLITQLSDVAAWVENHADLARDPKAITLLLKCIRHLVISRGPKKTKTVGAISQLQQSNKEFQVTYLLKEATILKRLLSTALNVDAAALASLDYHLDLDTMCTHLQLLYQYRRAEALYAVPRGLHFGSSFIGAADDDEGGDDDEDETPTTKSIGTPTSAALEGHRRDIITSVFGSGILDTAKPAELPYLLAIGSMVKFACHAYDSIRHKSVSNVSACLPMLPWFRKAVNIQMMSRFEAVVDELKANAAPVAPQQHTDSTLLGLFALGCPVSRMSRDIKLTARVFSLVFQANSVVRYLPADKQINVSNSLLTGASSLVAVWHAPRFSARNPKRVTYASAREAFMAQIFGLALGDTTRAPGAAPLVQTSDGSKKPSAAPLPPSTLQWRMELAAGIVMNLLVGSMSAQSSAAEPAAQIPETCWLWVLSAAVSPPHHIRVWGIVSVVQLLQFAALRGRSKQPFTLPTSVTSTLSDPVYVSQLVMAVSNNHPGTSDGDSAVMLMSRMPSGFPTIFLEYSRMDFGADAISQGTHALLFERLAEVVPGSVPHVYAAAQQLGATTTDTIASPLAEAHESASLRGRCATIAEVFAGFMRFFSCEYAPANRGDLSRELVGIVAPLMDKLPIAWKADWGNMLRSALRQRHAADATHLCNLVFSTAMTCLLAAPTAADEATESTTAGTFSTLTRWTYYASCLLDELMSVPSQPLLISLATSASVASGKEDWHGARTAAMEFGAPLLPRMVERFGHPYKSCRDAFAVYVADVVELSFNRNDVPARLLAGVPETAPAAHALRDFLPPLLNQLRDLSSTISVQDDAESKSLWKEHFGDALFNMVRFCAESDAVAAVPAVLPFIDVLLRCENHPKKEFSGLAQLVTRDLAQNLDLSYELAATEGHVNGKTVIDVLCGACKAEKEDTDVAAEGKEEGSSSSWSHRRAALQFIIPMRARGLLFLPDPLQGKLLAAVENRLKDKQIEVQDAAATALIGFASTMAPAQQEALGSKYLAMANAKLPRKLAAAADSTTASVSDLMAFRDYKAALAKAIRRRYAGISGVSAVVRAHPFDVPPFLPELLSALSRHVSDPQPVNSAVRKVFTEFKHTHQDNWDKHQLAFTPDQLTDLVELLVSAHYYA